MSDQPGESIDIYEDDFFVITDDPDEEMVNVAFVERGLVMRFDYAEFLELAPILDRVREYVQRRVNHASENGH